MEKKVGLVEVWLGKIPDYFNFHVETILNLKTLDFYFFTNDLEFDFSKIKSSNFHLNYITEQEFLERFNSISSIQVYEIRYPKKIIDFKLSYFEMFSDYLKDYPYVGMYDIDTLFGDIDTILENSIGEYDFISVGDEVYHNRLGGPLMIMRNSQEFLELIKTDRYYETLLQDEIYGYGEQELSIIALTQHRTKIIHEVNVDTQNGGKNVYDVIWENGKLYSNEKEILFYHFLRKSHTKLYKFESKIIAKYNKVLLDDFIWVVHFSEGYEQLLPYLADSIKKYSNRKCVFYSINYDLNREYKTNFDDEQFIHKRIDIEKGNLDNRGRDINIMCSKPKILTDAIESFPGKKFVHIDTDIYLTVNADKISKFFKEIENYPLINSHIHDVIYLSGINPNEEWSNSLEILMKVLNIQEEPVFPRRKCNIILFDENCKWFFGEQMKIFNEYKNNSTPGLFAIFDEDIANALLSKYKFTKSLPLIDIEESYDIEMNKLFDYSYSMTNISEWAVLPKTTNDVLFFHGFKFPNDYNQIIQNYGNKVIESEEMIISYSNKSIIFEKNSFHTTKKFENFVDFVVSDIVGNEVIRLENQDFFNYWTFYISDLDLSNGTYRINIFESTTKKCLFNDLISIKPNKMDYSKILNKFEEVSNTPSDINEHLSVLKKYASECNSIVEMGVRWITSTWAFLAANPKKLISLDLYHPSHYGGNLQEVFDAIQTTQIQYTFIQQDSLTYNMEECDLLFLDTWHDYLQLKKEIFRHHSKVKKYMIFHDTVSYGFVNEDPNISGPSNLETNLPKGLCPAIDEFLFANKNWVLWEKMANNNGLTILKRVSK